MNGNDARPAASESAFRRRLDELGATLIEDEWMGTRVPHRVRCAAGHDCAPWPGNVIRGQGVCNVCAKASATAARTAVAEAEFRALLVKLGATLLDPWKGTREPHRVRCAAGHVCTPWPVNARGGSGICRLCAGKVWDVLYVVASPSVVKFGITSGDPRPRLRIHRKSGLDCVAVWRQLPGTIAPDLERELIDLLNEAGATAVNGREYFPVSCLDFVIDVITDRLSLLPSAP